MNHQIPFYYTRKVLAWLCLITGLASCLYFVMQGMQNFIWLMMGLILCVLAYFISPHNKKKNTSSTTEVLLENAWDVWLLEMIYLVITLPIRLIIKFFKHWAD